MGVVCHTKSFFTNIEKILKNYLRDDPERPKISHEINFFCVQTYRGSVLIAIPISDVPLIGVRCYAGLQGSKCLLVNEGE